MAKHTRIYTRTGDEGTTGLVGGVANQKRRAPHRDVRHGRRVVERDRRGARRVAARSPARDGRATRLDAWLAWTQDALFNLGCELATPLDGRRDNAPCVGRADVAALERAIDVAERDLGPARELHPSRRLDPGCAAARCADDLPPRRTPAVTLLDGENEASR